MRHIGTKPTAVFRKSRLAGFFLCFAVGGCQDAPPPPAGHLALQQAQQALARDLPLKATDLLELAIRQGSSDAVMLWLAQTQPQMGPLRQWQRLQELGVQSLSAVAYQQLGLWQQIDRPLPPLHIAWQAAQCQLQVQPVLASAYSIHSWQQLVADWPGTEFGQLPICFLPPRLLDSQQLACSEQPEQRIQCQEQTLWPLALNTSAQLLVVMAGRGTASYNNGLILLPEHGNLALLQHEISHAFGFIDEYAYSRDRAQQECVPGRITANLLFSRADLPAYLQYWQLSADDITLTAVATCGERAAFKVVAATTHMQHYELAVPALYIRLIRTALQQPADILPVSYYFAAKARQAGQMEHWRVLMQQAASQGYQPAQRALAMPANLTAR